ncbi:MAG: trigger factor [Chloroflexi bacterium]|nr:trigger factor [Chloroflexota bacterium]
MKVTRDKTESRQAFLTIEMEPTEIEESLDKAYQRLVKRTNVPGFRKGKTPRTILERYLGSERLFDDALDNLIPEAYRQAIKDEGIEPFAQPHIELVQKEPVIFKAVVPLKPSVKLGDYRSITLEPSPVEEVTETQVEAVLEELRHRHAAWEPVERLSDFNDVLVIDIEGTVEGKSVTNQKGVQYQPRPDATTPVPGFAEQLTGIKKGETKEFKLQLPADHQNPDLAGKEALFRVTVAEIRQEVMPDLNDEFAKRVGTEFESLAALRQRITDDMKQAAAEKAKADFENRVIDAVTAMTEVEYPPVLMEAEIDDLLSQRFQKGQAELDAYLMTVGKTQEQLRQDMLPAAVTRLTRALVLGEVAGGEKIEVSDVDIDAEIEAMTKGVAEKKDEFRRVLNTAQNRQSIGNRILTRKTVQKLVEMAGGSPEAEAAAEKEEKN